MFKLGDTVALTASTIFALKQTHPEVYEKLVSVGRTGGKITAIEDNAVTVDLGEAFDHPLIVSINQAHPQLALQLVQRENSQELAGPEPVYHQMATLPLTETTLPVREETQETPAASLPQFSMPPALLEALTSQVKNQSERVVPIRVQIAQWVLTQFVSLKQYAIAQDINHNLNHKINSKPEPGDEWKAGSAELRLVNVELADHEDELYGAALNKIQEWIEQEDSQPLPVATPGSVQQLAETALQPAVVPAPQDPVEVADATSANGELED